MLLLCQPGLVHASPLRLLCLIYSHIPFALPSLCSGLPFALKATAANVAHLNALSTLSKFSVGVILVP